MNKCKELQEAARERRFDAQWEVVAEEVAERDAAWEILPEQSDQ